MQCKIIPLHSVKKKKIIIINCIMLSRVVAALGLVTSSPVIIAVQCVCQAGLGA